MKIKHKKYLKIMALLIFAVLLLPMVFACGEKPETASTATESAADEIITEPPATNPPPTDPPPPTEPPPTEPPTEPFVVDLSMPYWEQIQAELAHYGLTDGLKVLPGEDEAALMKKFAANSGKREELDVSGDGVPFSAAYKVTIAKDTTNFWDASYTCSFEKDLPVEEGDLIVGVIWVRGVRLAKTDQYAADDFPTYYMAIKTATDNWATEGQVEPMREQFAQGEWQKVFFYGSVLNEESNSKNLQFQIFLGYGNQQLDFGGITAYRFPWSRDNEKSAMNLVN